MLKYKNCKNEIGIDEAGRGPLFGRVYAGAVIWDTKLENNIINDSKKLSIKKRAIAFDWILNNITYWGVGYATEKEIDKINILNATKLAIDRAIENLLSKNPKINVSNIIIDGCNWEKFNFNYDVESVIKGDTKYYSIACASIIAKEFHDKHINELLLKEPELNDKYDLAKNMGYGTKNHLVGLEKYGPSKYHRLTFKRCK